MSLASIGVVAKATELSVETIRYYECEALEHNLKTVISEGGDES